MAQVAEHILGKDEVTSSNLVSSSKRKSVLVCLGLLRTVVFYRNAGHCEGQENREKFYASLYFFAFFIAVDSTSAEEYAGEETEKAFAEAKDVLSDEKFILQKGWRSLSDKDARVGNKSKTQQFYGYKAEDVLNDCKDPVSGNNTVLHEYNEKLYSWFSKSMGNSVVADEYRLTQLTLKPEPFVNRVKAAMARHGYGYIMNPVDYKIRAEETFFIEPTDKYEELFYKDPKYSYQLETRIFITGKQFWNVFERYNLFIGKFQEDTYWKSYNPMKFLLEVILEEADEEQIE